MRPPRLPIILVLVLFSSDSWKNISYQLHTPRFLIYVACPRLSVVGDERKHKSASERKNEGGLRRQSPLVFFSLSLFFPFVPNYREPGTGYNLSSRRARVGQGCKNRE